MDFNVPSIAHGHFRTRDIQTDRQTKTQTYERHRERFSNWILTSCQPHRVTSGQEREREREREREKERERERELELENFILQ